MNEDLQAYARGEILKRLKQCTAEQQLIFKRMYSHNNLDSSLESIVASMSEDKLDWAMSQLKNTLLKNSNTK